MRVLVTGSAGHLGEALVRTIKDGCGAQVSFKLPGEQKSGDASGFDRARHSQRWVYNRESIQS